MAMKAAQYDILFCKHRFHGFKCLTRFYRNAEFRFHRAGGNFLMGMRVYPRGHP